MDICLDDRDIKMFFTIHNFKTRGFAYFYFVRESLLLLKRFRMFRKHCIKKEILFFTIMYCKNSTKIIAPQVGAKKVKRNSYIYVRVHC